MVGQCLPDEVSLYSVSLLDESLDLNCRSSPLEHSGLLDLPKAEPPNGDDDVVLLLALWLLALQFTGLVFSSRGEELCPSTA